MAPLRTKINKKELILTEAAKLFKDRGFGGTGMRDIAEKVGMEAASMYNHIKSKDEILELICFKIADAYTTQLSEIEALEESFQDKLKMIIKLHVELIINDAAAVSVANNDWKYLRDEKKQEYKSIRKSYERSFANVLEQGMETSEFKTINVSVALFTILSSLRWIELWYKPSRNISADELEEELSTILLNGINI
ncbi:TetR/AcrR family transcriptional regulator [Chryseobacterium sp. POL2]|uniref:TetR/AcrR family transcriptional regulator n=1 Tax=Chryseobacterium sp. POL2 TaxID=2713414 RepID=UPI0013E1A274|nr:TetR/AcrR family transcriptional regulator [Chryseobacterium sp. POL2]QIG90325.1 TetR/AcrR family transcriptional regulator [Chryseobacterium sp. POL2]